MAMIGYAALLWAQTLLALALLGLAGGWALWPFREGRPYLWLAAPLAGLLVVGVALTVLNYLCRLPVPLSLLVTFLLLPVPTLLCLFRRVRRGPKVHDWKAALLALLAVSGVSTYACNATALPYGEPTIAIADGSDEWGYAAAANWLLRHPGEAPAYDADRPNEAFLYGIFVMVGDRPSAHLLTASACYLRGTSAIFSYDWLTGVGLGAGVLGMAGAFAVRRRGLLVLLAAAVLSMWLTLSRQGYLGKLLAYPGCLLLTGVFLAVWRRPTVPGLAAAALLGVGVGLSLNPTAPPVILALPLVGGCGALILQRLFAKPTAAPGSKEPPLWRRLLYGVLIHALLTIPLLVLHASLYRLVPYTSPLEWSRMLPIVLDLDNPGPILVGVKLGLILAAVALPSSVLLLGIAYRQGNLEAASCLPCVGVILVAWLLNLSSVYLFQGILFPLTAVGAALVLQHRHPRTSGLLWQGAVVALTLGLLVVRVPQFQTAWERYVWQEDANHGPRFYKQSEVAALRNTIGDQSVDVSSGDIYNCLMVWEELASQGVRVQYREPSWWIMLNYTPWKMPDYPKAEFTLRDKGARVSPSMIRVQTKHFLLAQDREAVALGQIQAPHFLEVDELGRPCFWQGHSPSEFEIWNGTGRTQPAEFVGVGRIGPSNSDVTRRTVAFSLGDRRGAQVLNAANNWQLRIPLEVPPGKSRLAVWSEDPINVVLPPPEVRELLLLISDFHLDPAPSSQDAPGEGAPAGASPVAK